MSSLQTANSPEPLAARPARHWTSGHIPGLDGLRGCAVLAVMFYHFLFRDSTRLCTGWAAHLQTISSWGWCGVDLFFVLSGFLITGILLDAKGDDTGNYFKSFYARRAVRIFPLYYGAVTFVAIAMLFPRVSHFFGFDEIRGSLGWMFAYLSNFYISFHNKNDFGPIGHFWSLAVEEHFYLVWPALVWFCSRKQFAWVCGMFVVGAVVLRAVIVFKTGETSATYLLTPCRVDGLAMGGLLALLVRTNLPVERVRKWVGGVGVFSLVALVGVSFLRGGFNHYGRTMNLAGFTLLAVVFASLLAVVISDHPAAPLRRAMEWRTLRIVGKYSFAMYVLHHMLLRPFLICFAPASLGRLLHSTNAGILAFAVLSALATYVLAFLSWHLYEKHFLRLKRFFPY